MDVQLHPTDRMRVTLPNYSYVLNFEKNFVYSDTQALMKDHFPYCFYYCAIYILLIFGGRRHMSNRPKLELGGLLALWNIVLALLSILCFSRMVPEMYHVLTHHGYYYSVCVPR
ncbi:elongation of very long chain fatty acids protein 6-like [Frieseomelitta varia]|uniref:elongation of very long chain fatty acids protein 6-like n=1 Tax=Frieseomelitta varia TaxID=561572 RepID=UPI001CB68484|nr:elongation of very long chain fatty acids protein 6-like [Frieseomelitta varia]